MTTIPTMTNQRGSMFGISLDTLNSWANAIYLIAVAVAAIASVAIYQLSARISAQKDREFAEFQLQAQRDIESARANAARANEAAAQARLEQERLRAQLAWRTLSPEAATNLESLLAQHPGKVNVQHTANDPEALYLAVQFANIFGKAKWEVQMLSVTMSGALVFGVWVPDTPSADTATIRDALQRVNISFSKDMLPPAGMSFGGTIPDAPVLFIGSKPPPQ